MSVFVFSGVLGVFCDWVGVNISILVEEVSTIYNVGGKFDASRMFVV